MNILNHFPKDWKQLLENKLDSDYIRNLTYQLEKEFSQNVIHPNKEDIFKALELTPLNSLKVVILGQDPYFNKGEANGLAFSVNEGIKIPPSLRNIFTELHTDLELIPPHSGDLTHWAKQGVLLLNTSLTVRNGTAGSHYHLNWHIFTDTLIKEISNQKENIVFVLWGNHARKKKNMIDLSKHYIIESAHPSPLSAYRGFFGSRPFSQINNYLEQKKLSPIQWVL